MMEILSNGPLNILVDQGRIGHLASGVSRSGPMDSLSYELGNAMLGNSGEAASLEINNFPFRVRFNETRCIAITGALSTSRIEQKRHAPWSRLTVNAGETLVIEPPQEGRCVYLAIDGGIEAQQILDSCSTDLKGAFGGFGGKSLGKGDCLRSSTAGRQATVTPSSLFDPELQTYWRALSEAGTTVRVLPSAEWQEFSEDTKERFFTTPYRVDRSSNRQGYRLAGTVLKRTVKRELLSHGIVPGTVQVPTSGEPIIQLVDANTCGGYPKLANVIEADLWKLGQLMPGHAIRFELTDIDTALGEGVKRRAWFEKTATQWR
ncbi:biotin-dependent carboxyltransferase family protein [Pseudomonas sp. 7P_10.2_Bac1]|uniref:5-oxoprolinase subunit C family protein n=1 Tax=Pseudomonas sp. 7P_10.2_Bac1 TaxID=2971614 RepID=UPI0021C8B700|nr:biotin-dependent carboxyltransferase family protein [Pseudomonas sp. 7P_10.2_Bac1]MCU1728593.1 biotin-dependent carboxyltransferase family protein [Pseudomonas sp. 7P_10.2_Bac1]